VNQSRKWAGMREKRSEFRDLVGSLKERENLK
jgi:hypothetical protein